MTPQIELVINLFTLLGTDAGTATSPARVRIALCAFGPTIPQIAGTGTLAKILIDVQDPGGGSIEIPLWGNDVITPDGTYYAIWIIDSDGNIVQCGAYRFTGSGTVDFSQAVPITPQPPIPPGLGVVLLNPSTSQTITQPPGAPFLIDAKASTGNPGSVGIVAEPASDSGSVVDVGASFLDFQGVPFYPSHHFAGDGTMDLSNLAVSYLFDAGGGDQTFTLPVTFNIQGADAQPIGMLLYLSRIDTTNPGVNTQTIAAGVGDEIQGQPSITLDNGESVILYASQLSGSPPQPLEWLILSNTGGGDGTVTHTTGALTAGFLTIGNGGADIAPSTADFNVTLPGYFNFPAPLRVQVTNTNPMLVDGTDTAIGVEIQNASGGATWYLYSYDTFHGGGCGIVNVNGSIGLYVQTTDSTHPRVATMALGVVGWSSGDPRANAMDLGLSRTAAKTLAVGNGTQGDTSGTVAAALFTGSAAAIGGVTVTGTPVAGQIPTATSGAAATWQYPPLTVLFGLSVAVAGTNVGPMLAAPRAGVINSCVIVTKTSDPSINLVIDVKKNGTSIFTGTLPTVAAGTSGGTVSTFTGLALTPTPVAKNDVFTIDVGTGSSSWNVTVQVES